MSQSQKRKQEREPFTAKLRVYWQEPSGRENFALATTVDISESGLSILIPNRIEPRTYVQVKADSHPELCGTASVRFCTRQGMNYNIGLEFGGGAKLKPRKQAPPTEPA